MKKYITLQIIVTLAILVMPMLAMANAGFDDTDGAVSDAPIDGGLSLLMAAGVGYGAKKLKEKRQLDK